MSILIKRKKVEFLSRGHYMAVVKPSLFRRRGKPEIFITYKNQKIEAKHISYGAYFFAVVVSILIIYTSISEQRIKPLYFLPLPWVLAPFLAHSLAYLGLYFIQQNLIGEIESARKQIVQA